MTTAFTPHATRTLLLQRVQELQAVQLELEGLRAALVARTQLLAVRARPRQRGRQVPRLDLPQAGESNDITLGNMAAIQPVHAGSAPFSRR